MMSSLVLDRVSRCLSFRSTAIAALAVSLAASCMPVAEETSGTGPRRTGGAGGSGSGGNSATGGSGEGGSSAGTGGSAGGGSGGASRGGAPGGKGGTGGSGAGGASGRDAGPVSDAAGDSGGAAGPAVGTFQEVALNVISNCVFCHPGEVDVARNTDFADSAALYDILTATTPTPFVPAGCAFKQLVVPGKPMESLLYLKLAGPPAGCGARMPLPAERGQPFVPIRDVDLELVRSWIAAGARR